MSDVTVPAVARIYTLADPRTLEVRYVGMTTQRLSVRLGAHLRDRRRGDYRTRWINTLHNQGLKPIISELEVVAVASRAEAEQKWIAYYRAHGARLVNTTDGGEGTLGVKKSAAERQKMSERVRLRFQDEKARAAVSKVHKGKTISDRHKQIVSEATTRRWVEFRATGATFSAESRARISAAKKGKPAHSWKQESRDKAAESKRQAWVIRKEDGTYAQVRERMRAGIASSEKRKATGLGTVFVDSDGNIHGTSGYNYGCRCDVCCTAQNEKRRIRCERLRDATRIRQSVPRFCADCGIGINDRHIKAKYCAECGSGAKTAQRVRDRKKAA